MNNNCIFIIVSESGSGKTTLVSALEKQRNLKSISSYTTRPKRSENEYGHTFVNEDEFSQLKDIVAYTEYNGYKYCATTEQVETHDLYVINPSGIDFFKKSYHGNKSIKIIYIKSTISTRIKRMEQRGDTFPNIMERIVNDRFEFANIEKEADFIVENNDDTQFNTVVAKAWEYIRKELNEE